jgi:DNA-binding CsgD family transcriptional regulator
MLLDRRAERVALARLLEKVRAELSGAVVLRGEAGIGKTALLEHTIESATDMRVVRVAGVESEMELGFAAVHQLLVTFLPGSLERLPEAQRDALGSAFGLAVGVPADLFLVGLAVLTLLADAATKRPLLCVVDDAQWLDQESAQALGFVARRLFADRIGILFGVREPDEPQLLLEGLPELRLAGLPDDEARALPASAAAGQLSKRVGDRIIRETGGNPLALVELGGELTPGELSGRSQLRQPLPLGRRPEERFLRRVQTLPADTQTLLLIAAAEPSGDQALLQRAAKHLGIGAEAADAATANRLLTFEPRVAFRHPLIRSAVYHGASAIERQRVHETLAAASDPELDADRRAWHLAAAASGPDEDVAAELERSADRARGRGGWASGAAFLERSAELTPDQGRRADRTLAAAQAKLVAGDPEAARALLEQAAPRLDRLAGAQGRRLEGEIRFGTGQLGESSSILLEAAREFTLLDTRLARDTLLEALEAASFARRFAIGAGVLDVVRAAREAPPTAASEATIADLLLDGFAARLKLRHAEAVGLFRRAIAALRVSDDLRWFGLGCFAASELLDDEARRTLARRWVTLARDQGALTSLPLALTFLGETEVRAGRFRSADAIHAEGREISAATGNPGMTGEASPPDLLVLVWRGYETEARSAAEAVRRDQTKRRVGVGLTYVNTVLAVLEISLGNYEAALSCAVSVSAEDPFYHGTHILPELVEAATRCGNRQAAAAALDRLSERALASRAPWALGLLARSRALLAEDALAESLYEAAIDRLERCDAAPDLARAHLVYGEWLRRQRRRKDARSELRTAHQNFESIGADAFAQRARTELLATGEHARKRTVETSDELTPQEGRIARLATDGASNPEIAAQLFISPSTVAYHLRKVFRKLDISSRTQLVHAMPDQAGPHVPESLLPRDDPRV